MAKKNQLTKSDALDIEDFRKLVNGLHADKKYVWELYARISFCTALRSSDVLSLRWSDIIGKDSIIKTEKKTGKTRRIPINEKIKKEIVSIYKEMDKPDKESFIFVNREGDKAMSIQYINRTMKDWIDKYDIKITNFSTHTFRKTFGRYVYDSSENKSEALVLLNTILNHSSIEITKVYIGLRDEEVNSVFSSLDI